MVSYYGDYPEDHAEIRIPFNTFDSNDPSGSVTITNLADADIKVHADGSLTQIVTDGASVIINFDGITGNHMVLIDSSVDAAYTTATEYAVRIEGTTVDGATINAWIGTFSIERAGGVLALLKGGTDGLAAHTTLLLDIPTVAEFNARTLVAASYFDPVADTVALVTTVTTAGLSAAAVDLVWDEPLTGGTHNVTNSSGRRIRQLQELGDYALGLVWLDSINGTAGTVSFENGVFNNPVISPADADSLVTTLSLHGVHIGAGSSITLTEAWDNRRFIGDGWTLALAGQSIAGSTFQGADISGVSVGVPHDFHDCHLGVTTFAGGQFIDCGLDDTVTLSGTADYVFANCYHTEAGAASTIDFGAAVGATEVHIHNWHGNLLIRNMDTGDILHFTSSNGTLTLDSSNTAGTANLAGTFGFTDNSTGMTINDNGQIYDRVGAPAGASIAADIADVPTVSEFNARTLVAASYFDPAADAVATVTTLTGHTVQTGDNFVKVDQLTFTLTNRADVNTRAINSAVVIGDGNATPWDGA